MFNESVIDKTLVEKFFDDFKPCSLRLTVFDMSKVTKITDDALTLLIQHLRKSVSPKVAVLCPPELIALLEKAELNNCVLINRSNPVDFKNINEQAFLKFENVMVSCFQGVFKKHLKVDMVVNGSKNVPGSGGFSAISYLTVGPFIGGIVLDFSTECLEGITQKLLGKAEDDDAVLADCACEVLNWTLGSAKSILVEAGYEVVGNGPPKTLTDKNSTLPQEINGGLVSVTVFDTPIGQCQLRTFAKNK